MRLHLHMIRALLIRANWLPADADRRVALLASMGARLVLVATLGGCGYSLPPVYYLPPTIACNPGDTDEGPVLTPARDVARKCRRVTP